MSSSPPAFKVCRLVTDRPVLREAALFYGLTFALTCAATALLWTLPEDFKTGDVGAIRLAIDRVGAVIIYLPAVTAVACTLAFEGWRGVAGLLRRLVTLRVSLVYYVIALLAPAAPQWLAAFIWAQITGAAPVYPQPLPLLVYWTQASLFGAAVLLGEEIAWRGFMLPRLLLRFGWRSAALIAGALWSLWHFLFWAPANYAATGSVHDTAIILLFAALGAMALSIVITWLFVRTRHSIAIAVLLHASGNASMGKVYDSLGDGAADPSWPMVYNLLLIAVAAVFMLLPDRRSNVVHDGRGEPQC